MKNILRISSHRKSEGTITIKVFKCIAFIRSFGSQIFRFIFDLLFRKIWIPRLGCFKSHVFEATLRSSLLPEVPSLASQVCQKEIRLPSHVSYIYYICMLYAERREQYQTILFTLYFLGTKPLQERYSGEWWTSGQSVLDFACFAARLQICNAMSILFVDFIYQWYTAVKLH